MHSTEAGTTMESTTVFEDNQLCLAWAAEDNKSSKHVDVRYQICREAVMRGEVNLKYSLTRAMVADIFTMSLET